MPVQVEQEQLEPCRVALTIEVPPDEIQKAVDSVYSQFARRTNVPGFRPGKAPAHLIKRFIDEGRVREMAMDQVLNNASRAALKQAQVEPYRFAEPSVELPEEEVDPEKGFSFKATVALEPHVHLGDVEGFQARRVTTKVSEEDVEREIQKVREAAAYFDKVDEPAQEGDRIRTTVAVTMDGAPVEDASFPEPTLIQVGANLKQLDEGLTGVRAGEKKTFDFNYPEDFGDEARRGKSATVNIEVSEVWRQIIPEADDELAKKAGFESAEGLRVRVRDMLQAQADALAEVELAENLVGELVRRSEVHYPEEMVERQVSARLAELIKALERRSLSLDQYLEAEETDLAALQARLREEALAGLTNTLVLIDFARANAIQVTEKEVEGEIKRRAEADNVKLSQMRRLLNDTGEIDSLRHRILYRKVADALRERAEIREVEA